MLDAGGTAHIQSVPGLELTTGVKHGQIENKSRKDASFKQADKKTTSQKPAEAGNETLESSNNAPPNEESREQSIWSNDLEEGGYQRPLIVFKKMPAHLEQKVGGYLGSNVRTGRVLDAGLEGT